MRSAVGCTATGPPVVLFEVYGYVRVVECTGKVILYVHISGRINVFI